MSARARELQQTQDGLTSLLLRDVRRHSHRISSLVPLISEYSEVAALFGAEWYEDTRDLAGARQRFSAPLADPAPEAQVLRSLEWASRTDAVPANTEGVATKLVLDRGRDTVNTAIDMDTEAIGWSRYARPGACYWCAMLATRGAVYKTQATALGSDSGYHNHCKCVPTPIFDGETFEPDAHVREWQSLYSRSTGHVDGQEKVREFRRAFESR